MNAQSAATATPAPTSRAINAGHDQSHRNQRRLPRNATTPAPAPTLQSDAMRDHYTGAIRLGMARREAVR